VVDGSASVRADLGIACRLAFGSGNSLSWAIAAHGVPAVSGQNAAALASMPPSVAAFHLAIGPDGCLYVTAPTIGPCDPVYRIDPGGQVDTYASGFGRPQGLAFDDAGVLHVVEALAGASGVYRIGPDKAAERVLAAAGLVGVAIDPVHGMALSSNDTLYRLPVRM
jgi:hypothetical protein